MKYMNVAVAAAVLCAAAKTAGAASGVVETVRFDAALTNSTEWTYSSLESNSNGYALKSQDSLVESPEFWFCVTSVVLDVTATAASTRSVVISPAVPENAHAGDASVTFTPAQGTDSTCTAAWDASLRVRSFSISATKGSATTGKGNIYLKSATIRGVALLEEPSSLLADAAKYNRVTLCWENPDGASAVDVEIEKDISVPFPGQEPFQCDFAEISNYGGNPLNLADGHDRLHAAYGELAGHNVFAPTNTSGVVQLGSTSDGGWLLFSGVESYKSAKLVVRARKYPGDAAIRNKMPVFGICEGVTNELGRIELSDEMEDHVLDISELQDGTQLLVRSAPASNGSYSGNGRVQLAFMGVAASYAKSATVGSSCRIRLVDLSPKTRYVWRARCRDESGNVSSYTDWNAFSTGETKYSGGSVIVMR